MTLAKHNFPLYVCMCEKHKIYITISNLSIEDFRKTRKSKIPSHFVERNVVVWLHYYTQKTFAENRFVQNSDARLLATRSFLLNFQLLTVVSMSSVNVSTLQFRIKLDHNCCLLVLFFSAKHTWRSWYCSFVRCICWNKLLNDQVTDVTEWPREWVTEWKTKRVSDRVTKWLNDWMTKWLNDQMIGWQDYRKLRRRVTVWYNSFWCCPYNIHRIDVFIQNYKILIKYTLLLNTNKYISRYRKCN